MSYLYGVSDGYTAASTVLPVSTDGVKVTVRGIEVETVNAQSALVLTETA